MYKYSDDELLYTGHLYCLACVRVKFEYASEQGGDKDTDFFLDVFEELYHLEVGYENGTSSSEQILIKTKEIII